MDELLCTARSLATDAACVEVIRAFTRWGIEPILLKGRTTADWLYPDRARAYGDSDLLVDSARVLDAARVLEELGFSAVPSHVSEHAHPWTRDADGATIDLHITIWGPTRDAGWVWRELQGWVEPYDLGPARTRVLTPPARALHIVLHAAQHRDQPRNPDDLRRALAATSLEDWRSAEQLADRLRALAAMAQGLMLEPAGREVLESLPLARAASQVDLRGASLAVGLARLEMARGPRRKAAVLVKALRADEDPRASSRFTSRARRLAWLLAGVAPTVRARLRVR